MRLLSFIHLKPLPSYNYLSDKLQRNCREIKIIGCLSHKTVQYHTDIITRTAIRPAATSCKRSFNRQKQKGSKEIKNKLVRTLKEKGVCLK